MSACFINVDVDELPCPCAEGFGCVAGRCVEGAPDDVPDAGIVDAGLPDAGKDDGGLDAGRIDAGDAGVLDAGVDAGVENGPHPDLLELSELITYLSFNDSAFTRNFVDGAPNAFIVDGGLLSEVPQGAFGRGMTVALDGGVGVDASDAALQTAPFSADIWNNDFSVELWTLAAGAPSCVSPEFVQLNNNVRWSFNCVGNSESVDVSLSVRLAAGNQVNLDDISLSPGWHQLVLTRSGERFTFYADGQPVDQADVAVTFFQGTLDLVDNGMPIDELRVWRGALSDVDVETLYDAFVIPQRSYWPLGALDAFGATEPVELNSVDAIPGVRGDATRLSAPAIARVPVDDLDLRPPMGLALWMQPDVLGALALEIGPPSGDPILSVTLDETRAEAVFIDANENPVTRTLDVVAEGPWHHVGLSVSTDGANEMALYLDGVRSAIVFAGDFVVPLDVEVRLQGDGAFDELRVFADAVNLPAMDAMLTLDSPR